jgi:hypothetical protein
MYVGYVTHLREYSFCPPGDPLYSLCESNDALEVSQPTHLVGQMGHVTYLRWVKGGSNDPL